MQRTKHTIFYKLGIALIVIGVFIIIYFIYQYSNSNIILEKLVSYITSTTGALGSLAGLFLVLDNLTLQRKTLEKQQESIEQQNTSLTIQREDLKNQIAESKQSNIHFKAQNDSLLNQQFQTTFFKLLENHSNLLKSMVFENDKGNDGLIELATQFRHRTNSYTSSIYNHLFYSFWSTNLHPYMDIFKNKLSFDTYIKNIRIIAELIIEKLDNQDLYHNILFNYLSVYERLYLGIYLEFEKNDDANLLNKCSFNYKQHFEITEAEFIQKSNLYFPAISISRVSKENSFIYPLSGNIFDFNIKINFDLNNSKLLLTHVKITQTLFDNRLGNSNHILPIQIPNPQVTYYENGIIFLATNKIIDKYTIMAKGYIEFEFVFIYMDNRFYVLNKYELEETDFSNAPYKKVRISEV